jgi:hypothetical protein
VNRPPAQALWCSLAPATCLEQHLTAALLLEVRAVTSNDGMNFARPWIRLCEFRSQLEFGSIRYYIGAMKLFAHTLRLRLPVVTTAGPFVVFAK